MSNKEENIDRFVKKVIAHYDVQYDKTHWEALEERLDAEMPVVPPANPPLNIPVIGVSVVGGMVLMLGILWMGGTFDRDKINVDPAVSKEIAEIPVVGDTNPDEKEIDQFDRQAQTTPNSNQEEKESLQNEKRPNNSNDVEARQLNGPTVPNENFNAPNGGLVILTDDSDEDAPTATSEQRQSDFLVLPPNRSFDHEIPVLPYELLIAVDQTQYIENNQPVAEPGEMVIPDKKKLFTYGIALGLSPDFNSVGMNENMELSGQAGIQFITTYRNRLSLSTGAFYVKKKYITAGENYYPPNNYWERFTNGVVPSVVDGHIVVIDIPINLTYNWNPKSRFQFISSFGVSNYFILSEDCTYKFSSYNPGTEYGWDSNEMTKELLGVGNLSLGVMWYIKPKVNLRVEPYIKVPFKDVGWGSVDLYSAGSLISIQYTFN